MPGSASRISGSAGCRAVPLLGRHHTLPPGRRRDRRQSGAAAACWAQRGAAAPLPALLPPLLRRRERRHQPPPRRHPHLEEAWAQARERDTKSHPPQVLAGVGAADADGTGRARRLGSPSSVGTCTPLARVRAWVAEGRQLSAVGYRPSAFSSDTGGPAWAQLFAPVAHSSCAGVAQTLFGRQIRAWCVPGVQLRRRMRSGPRVMLF